MGHMVLIIGIKTERKNDAMLLVNQFLQIIYRLEKLAGKED